MKLLPDVEKLTSHLICTYNVHILNNKKYYEKLCTHKYVINFVLYAYNNIVGWLK